MTDTDSVSGGQECLICLGPALRPTRLTCRCSLTACAACLFRWLTPASSSRNSAASSCPTCRAKDVKIILVDGIGEGAVNANGNPAMSDRQRRSVADRPLEIHSAAAAGDAELVRFMAECGEAWWQPDSEGETVAGVAAASGALDVLKIFVEEWGVRPSEPNAKGETALHLAARHGHADVVKFLLEHDAAAAAAAAARCGESSASNLSASASAASLPSSTAAAPAISPTSASPSAASVGGGAPFVPLHSVCCHSGKTALMAAIEGGHVNVCRVFLGLGLWAYELQALAQTPPPSSLKRSPLQGGGAPNSPLKPAYRADMYGRTAAHFAVRSGSLPLVAFLMGGGGNSTTAADFGAPLLPIGATAFNPIVKKKAAVGLGGGEENEYQYDPDEVADHATAFEESLRLGSAYGSATDYAEAIPSFLLDTFGVRCFDPTCAPLGMGAPPTVAVVATPKGGGGGVVAAAVDKALVTAVMFGKFRTASRLITQYGADVRRCMVASDAADGQSLAAMACTMGARTAFAAEAAAHRSHAAAATAAATLAPASAPPISTPPHSAAEALASFLCLVRSIASPSADDGPYLTLLKDVEGDEDEDGNGEGYGVLLSASPAAARVPIAQLLLAELQPPSVSSPPASGVPPVAAHIRALVRSAVVNGQVGTLRWLESLAATSPAMAAMLRAGDTSDATADASPPLPMRSAELLGFAFARPQQKKASPAEEVGGNVDEVAMGAMLHAAIDSRNTAMVRHVMAIGAHIKGGEETRRDLWRRAVNCRDRLTGESPLVRLARVRVTPHAFYAPLIDHSDDEHSSLTSQCSNSSPSSSQQLQQQQSVTSFPPYASGAPTAADLNALFALLLEAGADAAATDSDGTSVVAIVAGSAVDEGAVGRIKMLLASRPALTASATEGEQTSASDEGTSTAAVAVEGADPAALGQWKADNGPNSGGHVNKVVLDQLVRGANEDDESALMMAADNVPSRRRFAAALNNEALLRRAVSTCTAKRSDATHPPLPVADFESHGTAVVAFILSLAATPATASVLLRAVDGLRNTIFHYAAKAGDGASLRMIIRHSHRYLGGYFPDADLVDSMPSGWNDTAPIFIANSEGELPTHVAAAHGCFHAAVLLLRYFPFSGLDFDNELRSPADVATEGGYTKLAALFSE